MIPLAVREDWRGQATGGEADRARGCRAGPAIACTFPLSLSLVLVSLFSVRFSLFFPLFFFTGVRGPYNDRFCRSGAREMVFWTNLPPLLKQRQWHLGPHVAGDYIKITSIFARSDRAHDE